MEIQPLRKDEVFNKVWCTLNSSGQLATSTESCTGIFNSIQDAYHHLKYLDKGCDCPYCYVQEALVKGNIIAFPTDTDLGLPPDGTCDEEAILVLENAIDVLGRPPSTGGCRTFYSPKEWKERGEKYGLNSCLIICHDGGEFSNLCSYDKQDYGMLEKFAENLAIEGYYIEQCTCWYSALYKKDDED
jgi:hypothetical protein